MDSLFGLPAHPLLVHGAVVLVPLAAIGAVVISVSASLRRRLGAVVVGLALVAFVFTFFAKESGESLEEKVDETDLVEEHAELGDGMPVFAFALLVTSAGLVVVDQIGRRPKVGEAEGEPSGPSDAAGGGGTATALAATPTATTTTLARHTWVRPATVVLAALTVLASVAATVQVARVGHSGAKATWDEVQQNPAREGGEPEGEGERD